MSLFFVYMWLFFMVLCMQNSLAHFWLFFVLIWEAREDGKSCNISYQNLLTCYLFLFITHSILGMEYSDCKHYGLWVFSHFSFLFPRFAGGDQRDNPGTVNNYLLTFKHIRRFNFPGLTSQRFFIKNIWLLDYQRLLHDTDTMSCVLEVLQTFVNIYLVIPLFWV